MQNIQVLVQLSGSSIQCSDSDTFIQSFESLIWYRSIIMFLKVASFGKLLKEVYRAHWICFPILIY